MVGERDLCFHIQLSHIDPPIWRRLRVRADLPLSDLHLALQAAMGWEDSHLYEFRIEGRVYAAPRLFDDGFGGGAMYDARTVRLLDLSLEPGDEFVYLYDMGDDWRHSLCVEDVEESASDAAPALCLGGARRCPPEDCGGASGYESMLAALRNPSDPQHADWKSWVGPDFDPERFSLETANATLVAIFEPGGRADISELPPEVLDRVDQVIWLMEEAAEREPRISEDALEEASELLRRRVAAYPEEVLRAHKLEGWAGGALHAAFLLDRSGALEPMTLKELGQLFGVSFATIGQRSSALRNPVARRGIGSQHDTLGFPSGLSAAFREAWEETYRASDEAERTPEDAPAWVVAEELLRAAEEAPTLVAVALELRAAELLSASAAALDDQTLAGLIRAGMHSESEEVFTRFLALAIREFGVRSATSWLPPEHARGHREPDGDGASGPDLRLI